MRHTGLGNRDSRSLLAIALSEARLATCSTVQGLILDIVLGAAVAGRGAAAVEEAVGTSTGACDASLGVAANVDLGNSCGESRRGGGGLLGCAGLHGGGGGLAGGRGTGEGVEAGLRVAVVDGGSTPEKLSVQGFANGLATLLTIHTESSTRSQHTLRLRSEVRSFQQEPQTPATGERR